MRSLRSISVAGALAVALATASASAQCTAPTAWFPHSSTSAPDFADPGFAKEPADHCKFHRWSWQTFLYLTQSVGGDLRFVGEMHAAQDLFNLEEIEKSPDKDLPEWRNRPRRRLRLRPRDTKPVDVRGGPQMHQAGDNGILVDQRGHAVYYAIHVNQTFYDFIKRRQYYIPEKLRRASPAEAFPVGSLEVKSAWMLVDDGDEAPGYYKTKARIQLLTSRTRDRRAEVVVDEDRWSDDEKTVVLVGLHVAGVVQGHPEFVWATFEHRRNAPPLPPRMTMDSPDPVSAVGATFYAAGTPATSSNRPNNGQVKLVDPARQKLEPITQVVREIAPGGGGDPALIRALNGSVHAQLRTSDPNDAAAHYDLIGSLWITAGALRPNAIPGAPDDQQGSVRLSNTTMETFRQSIGNCFTCHDTEGYRDEGLDFPPKELNLSHALRRSYIRNERYVRRKTGPSGPVTPRK